MRIFEKNVKSVSGLRPRTLIGLRRLKDLHCYSCLMI